MIDPQIWDSEQVMSLSAEGFKLYIYLIGISDDEGRFRLSRSMFPSRAFPCGGVTVKTTDEILRVMNATDLIRIYKVNGTEFAHHPNWHKYQKIDRPSPSTIPPPPQYEASIGENEHSISTNVVFVEDSTNTRRELDQNLPLINKLIKEEVIKTEVEKKEELEKKEINKEEEKEIFSKEKILSFSQKNEKSKKEKTETEKIPYEDIIQDLNLKAGTSYRSTTPKTRELIKARWNEGFRLSDFCIVHTKKCDEWKGGEYCKFLRPETLYGSKFESYLQQPARDTRLSDAAQQTLRAGMAWIESTESNDAELPPLPPDMEIHNAR